MIKIEKDYLKPPIGLINKKAQKKRNLLLTGTINFDSEVYRHSSVKEALEVLYHGKCAYCEAKVGHGSYLHVEHYRPKAKVKNDKEHPGYYWLAYEWSNLLWACQKCNIPKSSHFPVAERRVTKPGEESDKFADSSYLQSEHPLLLNPEIHDPRDHLTFTRDGKLRSISEMGGKTIEICKLNQEPLVVARRELLKLLSNIQKKIQLLLEGVLKGKFKFKDFKEKGLYELSLFSYFEVLENSAKPECEFSCFGAHLAENIFTYLRVENAKNQDFQNVLRKGWQFYEEAKWDRHSTESTSDR